MAETARKAFVTAIVTAGVVVLALALWKLRLVVALVFAGFIVAAAMRPGIDALRRHRVPRPVGLILHYAVFAGLIALALWFAVPRALTQASGAIENLPRTRHAIGVEAKQSSGIRQEILLSLQRRLKEVPSGHALFQTLKTIGMTAVEFGVGIFFVFAVAGYWIFERERAMNTS
jgi:predicted PurR-regulated permease PerM